MVLDDALKNKVCLITGASKGIGLSVVETFLEHGAIVYANARSVNSFDLSIGDLSAKYGERFVPIYFDVTDFPGSKNAILKIKKEQGRLDVLINNAGVITYELLPMIDFDKTREMFEVNVIASIYLMQLAARLMSRQKQGSIINMASLVGVEGAAGQLAYSATKGALVSATKSAAKELAEYNIRVNAIAPGMVGTERFKLVMEEKFKHKLDSVGFGRLADPQEIADACLYFASDLSTYTTGQVLKIDGSTIL